MYFSFVHISSFATKLHFSSESQTILWEKLRMVVGEMGIKVEEKTDFIRKSHKYFVPLHSRGYPPRIKQML
jgi:hypothetical protein